MFDYKKKKKVLIINRMLQHVFRSLAVQNTHDNTATSKVGVTMQMRKTDTSFQGGHRGRAQPGCKCKNPASQANTQTTWP